MSGSDAAHKLTKKEAEAAHMSGFGAYSPMPTLIARRASAVLIMPLLKSFSAVIGRPICELQSRSEGVTKVVIMRT